MENNRYTPKIIAEKDMKFAIPVYQRLFAWRQKEVRKLLFDLKEHFDRCQKEQISPKYYIGMMTVIPNNRGEYDLIDGQQRFTIMMLIASVLSVYVKDNGWNKFFKSGGVCRLAFTARSADNDYINRLEEYVEEYVKYVNRLENSNNYCGYVNKDMADAIACIHEFLKYEFHCRGDVESFAKKVFEHLTFFLAELPEEYLKHPSSLNKYFEVMNSAGKGLEQHEILMVELLRKCRPEDQDTFTRIWKQVSQMDRPVIERPENIDIEKYAEIFGQQITRYRNGDYSSIVSKDKKNQPEFKSIDAILPKSLEKSREQIYESHEDSLLTFPELLLLVLDLTLDEEDRPEVFSATQFYQKDKLLSNFERFKVDDIKAFCHRLLFVRTILDYYVVRRDFVDGQGSYKLIYRAEGDADTRARLRQYESMLYVSTDFHRWLKPLMKYLMEEEPKSAQAVLDKLKAIDSDIHKWPGKEAAKNWKYPDIDRYWFWRLDYCLWDRRDELFKNNEIKNSVERYVFRENRSIEHLHPQDQSHNEQWPKEDDVNSFGNLAMISQSFNSTQSNDHIQVKFARIQEQIGNKALQSIKLLKMCMDADFEYTKWTTEIAKNHKNEMIELLDKDISNTAHSGII